MLVTSGTTVGKRRGIILSRLLSLTCSHWRGTPLQLLARDIIRHGHRNRINEEWLRLFLRKVLEALRVCERIIEAKDALEMTKDEVLAAASRAASKMAAARVKRLEGDVEMWRREQRSNYAIIANTNLRLEIARVLKEKEIELDAMRKKNDPRITERARREESTTLPFIKPASKWILSRFTFWR
ncbi:hypothetical protein VYU27_010220 [Nannochloropsis oceanica]